MPALTPVTWSCHACNARHGRDLGGNPFHKACFPSGQVERRRLGFRYCECATPTDTDGDGIEDCGDDCPTDVGRSVDEDTDFDGVPDCRVSEGGMWEVVAKLNLGLVAAGALGYGSFKVMGLLGAFTPLAWHARVPSSGTADAWCCDLCSPVPLCTYLLAGSVCSAGAQLAPFVKTLVALAQCALLLADPVLDVASLYTFFEQEVAVAFVGCAVILAISAAFMVRLPGSPHKLLDGSFSRLVNWITRRGRPLACLRHTLAIIIMMGYWLVMFPLALATPAVELYRRDVLPAQPALWRAVRHCDCCTRRRRVRCLSGAANAAAVDMEAQGPSGTSGDADGAAGGVRTVVVTTPPAAAAPSSSNTAAKSRSPHAVDPADDGSSGSPRGGGDAAASGDGSDAAASTGREEADQGKWRRLVAMSVEAGDTVVHAQLTEALVEGLPQACLQLAQLTASAGDAGDIVVAASVAVTMLTMSLKTRVFLFVTRTKVMFVGLALLCAADGMLFFLAIATVFPAINDALQREGMHILFWPFAVDLASDAPWWAQATLWRAVMVLVLIGVCAGVTCYTDAGSRKGAVAREWRVDPWRCVCGSACASVCAMVSMAASMVLWNLLVLPLLLVVVTMTWSPLAIVVSAHLAFGDQESTLVASLHDFARSKAGLAVAVAWSAVNLTWGAVPLLMWHPGATWGWNGAANTLPRMIALVGYWECWAWGTLLTVGGACLELARKQRLGPAAALEKQ